MTRPYTGIGSRQTPGEMLDRMRSLGERFARAGWHLRSGGAEGADTAFENGARAAGGRLSVFLPWPGFNGRSGEARGYVVASQGSLNAAMAVAAQHHPAWSSLNSAVRKLMARNVFQVLGLRLDAPTEFVVCWAPSPRIVGGKVVNVEGGTGLAVRLAAARDIPVYHLGLPEHVTEVERRLEASINIASNAPDDVTCK